jgi:hypothetical protein
MTWKLVLAAFGAGLAGVVVALLLWTAYVDHQRITAMWQVMTRPPQQQVAPAPEKKELSK